MTGRKRGRPRNNGPDMGTTTVRYEKEKMELIHKLGYTHSEAYAAGVEGILLSELSKEDLTLEELERKAREADEDLMKAAARKTLLYQQLAEARAEKAEKAQEREAEKAVMTLLGDLLIKRQDAIRAGHAKLVLDYIRDQDPTGRLPQNETVNFIRTNPDDEAIRAYVRSKLEKE